MDILEQPLEDNRTLLTNVAPWIDPVSKSLAVAVVALYVSGFLIVSLHYSEHGFIGTNPFRPRILAAGAWFFLFSAVPFLSAMRVKVLTRSWIELAQLPLLVYCSSILPAALAAPLFNPSDFSGVSRPHDTWVLVLAVVASATLIALMQLEKTPRLLVVGISIFLTIDFVQDSVRILLHNPSARNSLTLWFFSIATVAIVETKAHANSGDWEKAAFVILAAIAAFATFLYPHIKASWGGGSPIAMTMYFTKESVIKTTPFSGELLEESEEGYYVLGAKERNATFIPRNAVALVYFCDKVPDSPLMKPGEP